jgi:hypothetical protein
MLEYYVEIRHNRIFSKFLLTIYNHAQNYLFIKSDF